jgi:hypothetical protein
MNKVYQENGAKHVNPKNTQIKSKINKKINFNNLNLFYMNQKK